MISIMGSKVYGILHDNKCCSEKPNKERNLNDLFCEIPTIFLKDGWEGLTENVTFKLRFKEHKSTISTHFRQSVLYSEVNMGAKTLKWKSCLIFPSYW